MKSVVAVNLGCKLNFAEMATLLESLGQEGWHQVKLGQPADMCLVNTCSVTETAEQKCRQTIHKLVRQYPDAFMVVTGCYAQLHPEQIAAIPGVDLVLGADYKMSVQPYLDNFLKNGKCTSDRTESVAGDALRFGRSETEPLGAVILSGSRPEISAFLPACARGDRTRAFLKVQDGCDYFCSYCTVPLARGKSRNPSIASLVEQARLVAGRGGREIVISGVNIGTFGRQHEFLGPDGVAPRDVPAPQAAAQGRESLLELFQALDDVPGIERYRISSLEPDLLDDELIQFVAASRHFAPHFHLPLQSGCNQVLRLMGRRYSRELFADKVYRIKELMPQAFIGVDVIVGMRGETPEAFAQSESFLRSLPLSQLHVFTYSERPGTRALQITPVVPAAEKKRRSEALHLLSEEKRRAFYDSQLGRPLPVLFEHGQKKGYMYGFSDNYIRVAVPWRRDWENSLQTVTPHCWMDDGQALEATDRRCGDDGAKVPNGSEKNETELK